MGMSKSGNKKSRSSYKSSKTDITVVEIDEAVFGRLSERIERQDNRFNYLIERIGSAEKLLKGANFDEEIEWREAYEGETEEKFEKRIKRIMVILGSEKLEGSKANLSAYLNYLKNNVNLPCLLTGIEEFEWEEYYAFGPGNKKEYEKLKKTKASHTDTFKLISFKDLLSEEEGIFVDVQRVTDNKKFTLPLSYLEAMDEESANAELFDDYAVWFVNYMSM